MLLLAATHGSASITCCTPNVGEAKRHAPLGVHHVLQAAAHIALAQGGKAEARAARLQRRDDLADVVADQAEPRVARVLLDHCAMMGRSTAPLSALGHAKAAQRHLGVDAYNMYTLVVSPRHETACSWSTPSKRVRCRAYKGIGAHLS